MFPADACDADLPTHFAMSCDVLTQGFGASSLAIAFQETQKQLQQEVHPALATQVSFCLCSYPFARSDMTNLAPTAQTLFCSQWSEQVGTPAQRMLERFKAIKEDNGRRARYFLPPPPPSSVFLHLLLSLP